MEKHTTIAIKKETRDNLAKIGSKDQSFDDILQTLLKSWVEK